MNAIIRKPHVPREPEIRWLLKALDVTVAPKEEEEEPNEHPESDVEISEEHSESEVATDDETVVPDQVEQAEPVEPELATGSLE